jgi:hypothetical protein
MRNCFITVSKLWNIFLQLCEHPRIPGRKITSKVVDLISTTINWGIIKVEKHVMKAMYHWKYNYITLWKRQGALCYKREGRWIESRWGDWIFKFTQSFQPHYVPGVDSASNRKEYQEYSWNVLRDKRRSARKADNLIAIYEPIVFKMWEPQHLTTLWVSTACYRDTFTYFYLLTYESDSNFIVTCKVVRVTKWRVLVRMIGFITTLVTASLNTFKLQRYRWFTHTP